MIRRAIGLEKKLSKHDMYEEAVQSPEADIEVIQQIYRGHYKKSPARLREDFCGTGFLACTWVAGHPARTAVGVDLHEPTVDFGKERHFSKLTDKQKQRMDYVLRDVRNCEDLGADVIAAFNFSYYIFKERRVLVEYFRSCLQALNEDGMFLLDVLGGSDLHMECEEATKNKGFTYYWDLQHFNPITNEGFYAIHFKVGSKKLKNQFTYDWRLWSLPELMDILREAGFGHLEVYWEDDNGKGGRSGDYFRVRDSKKIEQCESWVAYLAAFPSARATGKSS